MLVSDLSVMCNFTQCSTHTLLCSAILHTQCSTHTIQCSAIPRNVFHFSLRNYTCSFVVIEYSNSKDETFK